MQAAPPAFQSTRGLGFTERGGSSCGLDRVGDRDEDVVFVAHTQPRLARQLSGAWSFLGVSPATGTADSSMGVARVSVPAGEAWSAGQSAEIPHPGLGRARGMKSRRRATHHGVGKTTARDTADGETSKSLG